MGKADRSKNRKRKTECREGPEARENFEKPETPLNIDDFTKVMPLAKGYELDPAKVYLIVADGKDFKSGAVEALMRDIRQMHPDLNIAVVATLKPKSLEVREEKPPEPERPEGA